MKLNDGVIECWTANSDYVRINNRHLHIVNAVGRGELVRHLCGNKRCVNPLHLLRGSKMENYEDEEEKRAFIVHLIEPRLNVNRYRNIRSTKGIWYSTIICLAQEQLEEFNSYEDVMRYGNEMFRKYYIDRLKRDIERGSTEDMLKERIAKCISVAKFYRMEV